MQWLELTGMESRTLRPTESYAWFCEANLAPEDGHPTRALAKEAYTLVQDSLDLACGTRPLQGGVGGP